MLPTLLTRFIEAKGTLNRWYMNSKRALNVAKIRSTNYQWLIRLEFVSFLLTVDCQENICSSFVFPKRAMCASPPSGKLFICCRKLISTDIYLLKSHARPCLWLSVRG